MSSTITAGAATIDGLGSPQAAIANPHGMSSRIGVPASLALSGTTGLTTHGTSTTTVTGRAASGATDSITFVWTVS